MRQDTLQQDAGEIAPRFRKGSIDQALLQDRARVVISNINLKQSLQGHDSSAMSDFHWTLNFELWVLNFCPVLLFC